MEKITLTQVSIKDKTSSAGKPYKAMGLKCKEYGENWLSGFANKGNENWKAGMEVAVEVTKTEKDGKTYINFKSNPSAGGTAPSSSLEVMDALKQIYAVVTEIRNNQIRTAGEVATKEYDEEF